MWSFPTSGYGLIHHVSRWLEVGHNNVFGSNSLMFPLFQTFPEPTMELITFWQRVTPDPKYARWRQIDNPGPEIEEKHYRGRVRKYNDIIVRLHLPDSLKMPS
jgi:hypothetical protein